MKIIELFAGLGSQTQALINLDIKHEVAAISEIDRFALISYEALHGKPNNLGDIAKITELSNADLWTYSFPCQDISLAGKQAGIKEGTRSGLLFEVERLLKVAAEKGNLPKYLLLENVKNLIGKNFKADFDNWVAFLETLGYKSYWKVLNTRDYCIPQNRERVFCISIRGEHKPYIFPEKRELRLRLKDMLDTEVEQKYYLSEKSLMSLLNATYNQERGRVQDGEGVHRTMCARDFKSPTCVKVGTLTGGKWDKQYKMGRRVYSTDGLSPTVHCAGGGNTELKIVDDTYKCRKPREYYKTAPTIRSSKCGDLKVVAGQIQPINRKYKADGEKRAEHFECRKDDVSNAVLTGDRKNCIKVIALEKESNADKITEPIICAMRGRNPDNPSSRKAGIPTVQKLETGGNVSNTITTVQKDNLVAEPKETFIERKYKDFVEKNGYMPEMFNPYNRTEIKDQAPTVTTQCGSITSSSSVLKAETDNVSKTVRIGGHGWHFGHTWDVIEQCAQIRKLTPWECLRLQGWRDSEIAKIRSAGISNSQAYKQAGNGITVTVLMAIFGELFGVPYAELLDNWDYKENNKNE